MPNYAVTVPTFRVNFFSRRTVANQFMHRHATREAVLWEWDAADRCWYHYAYDDAGDRYVVEKKLSL